MTYIELINNFWFLDEDWQFTCCETRLYFYLLKTANRLGWVDSWTRSDTKVASDVGVSVNSMKTARNRLVQAGLIAFKAGGNGQRDKTKEFIPPTLDQVKAYFEEKLPDWERQAEIFFYHFDSLGWRNANGAKIERWDSKANLWIMDEQAKQYQHGKQSENSCGGNKPSDIGTTAGKLKAVEL